MGSLFSPGPATFGRCQSLLGDFWTSLKGSGSCVAGACDGAVGSAFPQGLFVCGLSVSGVGRRLGKLGHVQRVAGRLEARASVFASTLPACASSPLPGSFFSCCPEGWRARGAGDARCPFSSPPSRPNSGLGGGFLVLRGAGRRGEARRSALRAGARMVGSRDHRRTGSGDWLRGGSLAPRDKSGSVAWPGERRASCARAGGLCAFDARFFLWPERSPWLPGFCGRLSWGRRAPGRGRCARGSPRALASSICPAGSS